MEIVIIFAEYLYPSANPSFPFKKYKNKKDKRVNLYDSGWNRH